jgi:hypothetical protein
MNTTNHPTKDPLTRYEEVEGHWLWTGPLFSTGYGQISQGRIAHRWFYEHFVGPIPDGYEIDHLCLIRHCVKPAHLEAVTRAENLSRITWRRTACPQGHLYTEENTHWDRGRKPGQRSRRCVTCQRARDRGRRR